jgi:hypothetical protein
VHVLKLALWPTELLVGWLFGAGRRQHGERQAAAAGQQQQQQGAQQHLKDR